LRVIRSSSFTTPRRGRPGSIRSSAGSRSCRGQSLTGASFKSVEELKAHIDAYIADYNETAEPFVWTKSEVHQRRVKGPPSQ
jgi:hypothetical protein